MRLISMPPQCLRVFVFVAAFSVCQCLLEASLGSMVETLQLTVQDLQGQVKALQNNTCDCGRKTPVFMATLSNDIDSCQKFETVKFDRVKVNLGGGYDNRAGVFRAPVAGVYAFTATLSVATQGEFHVALVKGNVNDDIGYLLADPQNIWLQRSTTVFTHLNVNDAVWMTCLDTSRIEGDHNQYWGHASDYHSHFSGFLVSPDTLPQTSAYP